MANFFLIDQSLESLGGHHHDYVRCVAAAATQSGYLTTIGANKKFRDSRSLDNFGQIKRVFRENTYQPDSYLSGLRHLTRTTSDFVPDLKSNPTRSVKDWVTPSGMFKSLQRWRHSHRRQKKIRNFAIDCENFFQSILFTEHDHAFFATVNEMEFMGLAAFLANHPRTLQVTWHLQFHFNLFDGRTPEYEAQNKVAFAIQNCFDAAMSRIPYHKLNFYTTSETLADQFNRLDVGNFNMLTYPVRPELFKDSPEEEVVNGDFGQRPLKITCPGEVRREKKMVAYLQPLINQIWDDHIQTENVQIVVQRPVRKWPYREKLELRPPESNESGPDFEWVKYFSHPLGDLEYLRLIQDTDIGLLFYDSRAYFSRRAGVLSELLTCGKPVIVPAGSWLGDQIAEPNFRYVDSLCNAHNRCRSLTIDELVWSQKNVPLPGGILSFDSADHPFELQFELEQGETGFVIEFDWHWPQDQGIYCKFELGDSSWDSSPDVQVVGHRTNGMSPGVFFKTKDRMVKLKLTNAFHDSTASIRQVNIHTLNVDPLQTPLGSVGFVAASEADIANAVDEMVAHFEHYRSSAQRFAQSWCRQHEPRQTLSSLVASETSARPAA